MIKKIIWRIKLLLNSFVLTALYLFKACLSQNNLQDGNRNFVVSMTTYGWRYNFVFLTIESILSQKIRPARIYLWIYKDEQPSKIAQWFLNRQINRGLIIKEVEKDVRSYKKLSYVLSNTDCDFEYVITADDDVFYPADWVRNFIEHPNVTSSILCNRGRIITFHPSTNIPLEYKDWALATENDNFVKNILPTGVSGICYPISSLDDRIGDFNNIEQLCPYADDVWYKLLTTSNGYQSLILENGKSHYPPVLTSLTKGLETLNVGEDLNIKQFCSSLRYFNLENHFNKSRENI